MNFVTRWRLQLMLISAVVLLPSWSLAGPDGRLANLPFLQNTGQAAPAIGYYTPTRAGATAVTSDGILLYLLHGEDEQLVVSEEPVNLLAPSVVEGRGPSPLRVSYFKGSRAARWRQVIPVYQTVTLGEVFPGVRVHLEKSDGRVEKIFRLAPGIDPAVIRLRCEGVLNLAVEPDGQLRMETRRGPVRFSAPFAYQVRDGNHEPVTVAYQVRGNEYGFRVTGHDRALPLVIDPLLASTFLGGGNRDQVFHTAEAADGTLYVTGATNSASDFPTMPGASQGTVAGAKDVFVAQFDRSLRTLLAVTFLGGSAAEEAYGIVFDGAGSLYVAGSTRSTNFPVTPGAAQSTHGGGSTGTPYACGGDMFVAKLSLELDTLLAATYLGGNGPEWNRGLALDATGRPVVTGYGSSTNYPISPGCFDPTYNAGGNFNLNTVVSILEPYLTGIVASTYLGGDYDDFVEALALDNVGRICLAGWTGSTDFPTSSTGHDRTYGGADWRWDGFVCKLSSDLTNLESSTYIGGYYWDFCYDVTVDQDDNLYVTGHTASDSDFPTTTGAHDPSYNGIGGPDVGDDAYVTLFSADLSTVLASTYLGGQLWEAGSDLAYDPVRERLFVGGMTSNTYFPTTDGAYDVSFAGGSQYSGDIFLSRFNAGLTELQASSYLGGTLDEILGNIVVAADGDLLVCGATASAGFPVKSWAYNDDYSGGNLDGFVCCLSSDLAEDGVSALPAENGGPAPLQVSAFPNPFNPNTRVTFNLDRRQRVVLTVHALTGACVTTLASREFAAGEHVVDWDGRDSRGDSAPSGVYLLRMASVGDIVGKKLFLVR